MAHVERLIGVVLPKKSRAKGVEDRDAKGRRDAAFNVDESPDPRKGHGPFKDGGAGYIGRLVDASAASDTPRPSSSSPPEVTSVVDEAGLVG